LRVAGGDADMVAVRGGEMLALVALVVNDVGDDA